MSKIKLIFLSLRPKSLLKNLFLFIPILFTRQLLRPDYFTNVTVAFFAFCLCSASVYLLNDIVDFKKDKLHPVKSQRPIAKGLVSKRSAGIISVIVLFFSLWASTFLSKKFTFLLCLYYVLNLIYSLFLKKFAIIGLISNVISFEIRIWSGSVTIGAIPGFWLLVLTFFFALFLWGTIRRQDNFLLEKSASGPGLKLSPQGIYLSNKFLAICAGLTAAAYILYSFTPEVSRGTGANYLILTFPFVIYAELRYLYLVTIKNKTGAPFDLLFSDRPLIINVVLLACAVFFIQYIAVS